MDVAENFIEDLDSSLGYIDILFEYLDNFTNDAVTYLQSKEIEVRFLLLTGCMEY